MNYIRRFRRGTLRDIKPHNILINKNGIVKLADFGFYVDQLSSTKSYSGSCGTVQFMAPETLCDKRGTPQSDYWSLGATLYYLCEGTVPFQKTKEEL